jgi:integrase
MRAESVAQMGEVIKTKSGYYIRYYDAEGKRRMRASRKSSHAEARKLLLQIEADIAYGRTSPELQIDDKLTVSELCARFLATSHPRVKDPAAYREAAKVGLRPLLPLVGKIPLQKLRRRDIEAARDKLSQKYKPNTVRACLRPLGSALSWAISQELITQSPMTKIPLPRRQYSTDRLSTEEAKRLLDVAKQRAQTKRPTKLHYSLFIGISLAIRLGLRRGEVFGLRWQDVDLVNHRLTVARSYEGLPKNGKPRTLPIPLPLAQELTEWKGLCAPSLLVCPLGKMGMTAFQKLLSAAECPYFARPWHALRHTFASLLVEQGGNILALKELLGHSSLDMTLIYSHLAPGALAGEVGKIKL